jgi:hypothetical protein
MPCFVGWNAHLTPGTPEYDRALAELRAKLLAVKHIVRYYYGAAGLDLPRGVSGADLPPAPSSEKERRTWKGICHHCACDGVHFTTLYDLLTILDPASEEDSSYRHVIFGCAHKMRSESEVFRTAVPGA